MDTETERVIVSKVLDISEKVAKMEVKVDLIEVHTGVMNKELGETRDVQKLILARFTKFPFSICSISKKQVAATITIISTVIGIAYTLGRIFGLC